MNLSNVHAEAEMKSLFLDQIKFAKSFSGSRL